MAVATWQQTMVNPWQDLRESPAFVRGRYMACGFAQLNITLACSVVYQVLL